MTKKEGCIVGRRKALVGRRRKKHHRKAKERSVISSTRRASSTTGVTEGSTDQADSDDKSKKPAVLEGRIVLLI